MIVTIHQPEHLPWLGFFNKIAKAEVYIVMDNVQFEKNYFQNRNKIIGTNGVQWLGLSVSKKGHMDSTLAETEIADIPKWREKYLQTIKFSYSKYPYFNDVYDVLEKAIYTDSNKLVDINLAIIKGFAEKLDIKPKFVMASSLDVSGKKSDLVLSLCEAVNATTYIAGPSGRDYMDLESFKEAGIEVKFNDYTHPVYEQRKTEEFTPYMSIVDLTMNCGFKEAKRIIMEGNEGFSEK